MFTVLWFQNYLRNQRYFRVYLVVVFFVRANHLNNYVKLLFFLRLGGIFQTQKFDNPVNTSMFMHMEFEILETVPALEKMRL